MLNKLIIVLFFGTFISAICADNVHKPLSIFSRPEIFKSNVDQEHAAIEFNFAQALDHFNVQDSRTFNQSYWLELSGVIEDAPIFIVLHGQVSDLMYLMYFSNFADIAKELGGIRMTIEPRFFSESQPTE